MKPKARKPRGAQSAGQRAESEWNFDERRVPDCELVACCLWEYARESKTLRELRERCVKAWNDDSAGAWRDDRSDGSLINVIVGTLRHQNEAAELFFREMVQLIPRVNSFPVAWQSLSQAERDSHVRPSFDSGGQPLTPEKWQSLTPAERMELVKNEWKVKPFTPLEPGSLFDAQEIVRVVKEHQKFALEREAVREQTRRWLQQKRGTKPTDEEVERNLALQYSWTALNCKPLVKEPPEGTPQEWKAPLDWMDRPDRLPGGFAYPGGTTVSVFKIDWAHFTDEEIGEALARLRPKEIPEPPSGRGRGNTIADWRARLKRLGIMRLMHYHSFDEIGEIVPEEWLKQEKYGVKAESQKEWRKAFADFQELLPFLDGETPLCFEPLPGEWQV